jgi:hypothetical protein
VGVAFAHRDGMGSHRFLTLVSLPLLAIPSIAAAQPAVGLEPEVEAVDAVFPTMGADGSGTELGAQVMLMDPSGGDGTLKRLDLHGQFVGSTGIGGYATLGASTLEGESSLGSLEAGGLYAARSGTVDYTARVGIVLPTSSDDDGGFPIHLVSTVYSRPSDYPTGFPDTTTARVAFAPRIRSGNFVARADVGLDMVLAGEGADEFDSPFLHVDVGAGFHNGKGGAVVELTTMSYLEETDTLIHLLAFTAELNAGRTTPYITISKPFVTGDDDSVEITNFAIGLRGKLGT